MNDLNQSENLIQEQDINSAAKEIDLKDLLIIFLKSKKFIFIFTLLTSLTTTIYSFFIPPVWKGSFEILVQEDDKKKSSLSNISQQSSLFDSLTSRFKSNNETQKYILMSPSVLMPIFEFVRDFKNSNNEDTFSFSYQQWLNTNIEVEFKEKSNVLEFSYMDTDKDFIIQTLNKISKQYQNYSKDGINNQIKENLIYLTNLRNKYNKKALLSLKEFNEFSIKNGIGDIDGFVNITNDSYNKINSLDKFSEFKNTPAKRVFDQSEAGIRFSQQFSLLEKYESDYTDFSAVLKPNSKTLKNLKIKIDNLRRSLKRPNEILIKYKELSKKAQRDSQILNQIENQLITTQLSKAKQKNPWELITQPYIYDKKVSPNKKIILLLSLFASFFGSLFIIIIKKILRGEIITKNDFLQNLKFQYLDTIYAKNISLSEKQINNILISKIKNDSKENLGFLFLTKKDINDNYFYKEIFYKKKLSKYNFNNIEKIQESQNLILFADGNEINNQDCIFINNYLENLNKNILGWVFIDRNLFS